MKLNKEKQIKAAGKFTYKTRSQLIINQEDQIHSLMKGYKEVLAIEFSEIKDLKIKFTYIIDTQGNPLKKSMLYRTLIYYQQ